MAKLLSAALAALLTVSLAAQDDIAALRDKAQAAFDDQDFEAAIELYRAIVKLDDKDAEAWHHLGYSLHARQQLDEALKAHLKASTDPKWGPTATYNVACVYSLRNDKDKAIEWLGKAVEAGFTQASLVEADTDMDNIRGDERYAKIVKSMGASSTSVRAFAPVTVRSSARLALFGANGSPGQVSIDYGQPPWKEQYAKAIDSENSVGKRWRFGADFWTTLDTNVDLTIGGTAVAAGSYYLALENKGEGKVVMVLFDPIEVRKKKLDAFQIDKTPSGKEVALEHKVVEESASKLKIAFKADAKDTNKATLVVHFGPHTLTVPVELHLN